MHLARDAFAFASPPLVDPEFLFGFGAHRAFGERADQLAPGAHHDTPADRDDHEQRSERDGNPEVRPGVVASLRVDQVLRERGDNEKSRDPHRDREAPVHRNGEQRR